MIKRLKDMFLHCLICLARSGRAKVVYRKQPRLWVDEVPNQCFVMANVYVKIYYGTIVLS